jgi:hypothetical protein
VCQNKANGKMNERGVVEMKRTGKLGKSLTINVNKNYERKIKMQKNKQTHKYSTKKKKLKSYQKHSKLPLHPPGQVVLLRIIRGYIVIC